MSCNLPLIMRLVFLVLMLLVRDGCGFSLLFAPCHSHARSGCTRMGLFDQLADNIKSLTNQGPTARISHVMLRTDEAALNLRTKGECHELLSAWKERIEDDAEKFEICARERSECASRDKGGDLGFKTREQMQGLAFDEIFDEEPGRVYGPIMTDAGLHLVYVHSRTGE